MQNIKVLMKTLLLLALISLIFPLTFLFTLSPAIDRIMISESQEEAFRLADHVLRSYNLGEKNLDETIVTKDFAREIRGIKSQFNLYKLSLFSAEGKIIFSTNDDEVGFVVNDHFFRNVVSQGRPYAKFMKKGADSLEGIPLTSDVVETYVPIIRDGKFQGAIEIYYDITEAYAKFAGLKMTAAVTFFFISVIVLSLMAVVFKKSEERKIREAAIERELTREQLKGETILAALGDSVIIQDREYKIIYQNRVNKEMFGDHLGEYCYKVYEGLDTVCKDCPIEVSYQDGLNHSTEKQVKTDKGMKYFEVTSSPLRDQSGAVIAGIKLVRDITEKRKLEEQLRQTQKLEALGTLTSGVSHEFNNVLSVILGYAELALEDLSPDDGLRKNIEIIHQASKRAERLTRGLLAYSRKQITEMKPMSLNDVIRDIEGVFAGIIGSDIMLRVHLSSENFRIMADKNQVEQVLINVISNARDAMPEGGTLTLVTRRTEIDDSFMRSRGFGRKGHYGLLSVEDSGLGMDERTVSKIFEPFFTTKEIGKGTGLGLAIVYGIVKKHNGYIDIISSPGSGTKIMIYFPLVPETEAASLSDA